MTKIAGCFWRWTGKRRLFLLMWKDPCWRDQFVVIAKPGSRKAVEKICKRFPIVFLQKGFLNVKAIRSWLKKNDFPDAPVLPWSRGEVFDELKEKDLKIKAIIGGPEVIASAESYKPRAFSFDSVEDAEVVENWEEIEKKLK